ncbi:MAG: hypothetical protein ACREO1_01720 [Arenimonas sp.]
MAKKEAPVPTQESIAPEKRMVVTQGVATQDLCDRVAVKDEVFYRQMAATNIRKQFEDGEIYFQGVERCKETIFIYYQLGRQSQFAPTNQVLIDAKTLAVSVEPGE